jgi:FAD/FMN-containing dehydrogenase
MVAMAERHGVKWEAVSGQDESDLWRAHADRPWAGPGCVLKISVMPEDVVAFVEWVRDMPDLGDWELVGRAALGVVLLRLAGEESQARFVTQFRKRSAAPAGRAHVSLLRADPELKRTVRVWEEPGDTLPLMQAIKRQFDPAGILNPGRGPGGL